MEKNKTGFLSEIISKRAIFLEILFVALFIGLGVNLIADSLPLITGFSPSYTLVLGIGMCLISILYLAIRLSRGRKKFRSYKGLFLYNEKKNELKPINRYGFSEQLNLYIAAAFSENKALKSVWDKEPLKNLSPTSKEKPNRSRQIICEAVEYFVLHELWLHLSSYFENDEFREENLKEFSRNDIPDVLLQNRFLELFSRPMEDRPSFVEDTFKNKGKGETVAVYIAGGALFEKFHLILPTETTIRRLKQNEVQIETKKFVMAITVRFDGFNTNVPYGFFDYYLKLDKKEKMNVFGGLSAYKIDVDISVHFKLGTLWSGIGLQYYRWVDSFLDVFEQRISSKFFFESIGWDSALTLMEFMKYLSKNKDSSKNKKEK